MSQVRICLLGLKITRCSKPELAPNVSAFGPHSVSHHQLTDHTYPGIARLCTALLTSKLTSLPSPLTSLLTSLLVSLLTFCSHLPHHLLLTSTLTSHYNLPVHISLFSPCPAVAFSSPPTSHSQTASLLLSPPSSSSTPSSLLTFLHLLTYVHLSAQLLLSPPCSRFPVLNSLLFYSPLSAQAFVFTSLHTLCFHFPVHTSLFSFPAFISLFSPPTHTSLCVHCLCLSPQVA